MIFMEKHLEEAEFDINWSDSIVSFGTTKKYKPDVEPLLHAIGKLDVKPEEAAYIGDSTSDYACARNAKVEYIAVLTGLLRREDLEKQGVNNIMNSVFKLPNLLRKALT